MSCLKIIVYFLVLIYPYNQSVNCMEKVVIPCRTFIQKHPIITAAAIALALNSDPQGGVQGTLSYLLEQHPVFCIAGGGVLLSCSLDDISRIEMSICAGVRYAFRGIAFFVKGLKKFGF